MRPQATPTARIVGRYVTLLLLAALIQLVGIVLNPHPIPLALLTGVMVFSAMRAIAILTKRATR
jgi:hypothetical protein